MQKLLILHFLFFMPCHQKPHSQKKQIKPIVKAPGNHVYLKKRNTRNDFSISEKYRFEYDVCQIDWVVLTSKETQKLQLRLRYSNRGIEKRGCLKFSDKINSHQKILNHIFKKYYTSQIISINTPSLQTMNPKGDWTEKIKELSIKNQDWIEYIRYYPQSQQC